MLHIWPSDYYDDGYIYIWAEEHIILYAFNGGVHKSGLYARAFVYMRGGKYVGTPFTVACFDFNFPKIKHTIVQPKPIQSFWACLCGFSFLLPFPCALYTIKA